MNLSTCSSNELKNSPKRSPSGHLVEYDDVVQRVVDTVDHPIIRNDYGQLTVLGQIPYLPVIFKIEIDRLESDVNVYPLLGVGCYSREKKEQNIIWHINFKVYSLNRESFSGSVSVE
jgi:hypothetical protein